MVLDQRHSPGSGHRGRRRTGRRKVALLATCGGAAVVALALVMASASAVTRTPTTPVASPLDTPVAPATTAPASFSPPSSWGLKFDASFQGDSLDPSAWQTCYSWAGPQGCTNFGNTGDPEQEWYLPSQAQVDQGTLALVAQREPTTGTDKTGNPKTYACRSGMATTYPGFSFEYGYMQITAKIPFGQGLWPAFWLAAKNGKWPPEIDILEHWHSENYSKVYLHPVSSQPVKAREGGIVSEPGLATGWHTFGLYWTKTSLVWYYDGKKVFSTSTDIPAQQMYLIMNLAVDDASPGGCNGSLLVKSVKVWEPSA